MDTSKILSGREIVARGVTKTNTTLPEAGQKEISSSGSWLESKQIQSALEARKHLLEVERIEKLSSLSVAIWRDDLKLAEVIKKAGGYWQYIGHNVGKHLYLRPEETLFLIEINSLLLKHNGVIVSLQKAYTLCIREINLAQYKVYASLSRLGFRVFRHKDFTKLNKPQAALVDEKNEVPAEANVIIDVDMSSSDNGDVTESINMELDSNNINDDDSGNVSNKNSLQTNSSLNSVLENNELDTTNENLTVTGQDENTVVANLVKSLVTPKLNSIDGLETNKITHDSRSLNAECIKVSESNVVNSKNGAISDKIDAIKGQNIIIVTEENDGDSNTVEVASENIIESTLRKNTASVDIRATENKDIAFTQNDTRIELDNTNIVDQANKNENTNKVSTSVMIYEGKKCLRVHEIDPRSKIPNEETISKKGNLVLTYIIDERGVIRAHEPLVQDPSPMEVDLNEKVVSESKNADSELMRDNLKNHDTFMDNLENFVMNKIQRLSERRRNSHERSNDFSSLPDCFAKKTINMYAPEAKFLPKGFSLNNSNYVLNLEAIKRLDSKHRNNTNAESSSSGVGRDVNRRLVSHNTSDVNFLRHASPIHQPVRLIRPMFPIYSQQYFMPRNVVPPNFMPNHNYSWPRAAMNQNFGSTSNFRQNNPRKRGNPTYKAYYLRLIRNMIARFKMIAPRHNQGLIRIINTYNEEYDERYYLTDNYKLINSNEVQEVVIVNDDGRPKPKKARLSDDSEKINKHLEKLRSLATKLKDLDAKNLSNSRHRRVLSNAIKAFNKHFHADIYLNVNFEIIDSKLITLDSNSDSDSVVAVEENSLKRKKLRNPFNILKYSGRMNVGASSSSRETVVPQIYFNNAVLTDLQNNSKSIENRRAGSLSNFHKGWLPKESDFGRPEICSREEVYLFDIIETECSRAFSKYRVTKDFESWVELKMYIMEQVHERIKALKECGVTIDDIQMSLDNRIQPLVSPDCVDISSALEKLQVIPTAMPFSSPNDFEVNIDFDVYYGNSPSFKKANRPQPHFRVFCFDVSDDILSSRHIEALTLQSRDNVPILIAAIGFGSISYIQVKNMDIPVYIPDNF